MVVKRRAAFLASMAAGFVLVLASVGTGLVAAATAGTTNGGNGLRVSPVVTNLTINPGETQAVTVNVQNVTSAPVTLQALVNDFVAAPNSETGEPALLLNPNDYAPTHSLKRYIAPLPNITLQPNESKAVRVNITIPKGTSGGGYFGAVRFAPASAANGGNVTLSASVASLILVRVPGNFKEQLNIASIDIRQGANNSPRVVFVNGKDLVAVVRLQNVGDVQEQPFGKLLLKQGNSTLASYELNDATPRGNVLPGSVRAFTIKLDKVGVFGKYTVSGSFGYGTSGQVVSGQTTFYVIPVVWLVVIVALIALALFFVFGFPRLRRRYDQSVMRRSRSGK